MEDTQAVKCKVLTKSKFQRLFKQQDLSSLFVTYDDADKNNSPSLRLNHGCAITGGEASRYATYIFLIHEGFEYSRFTTVPASYPDLCIPQPLIGSPLPKLILSLPRFSSVEGIHCELA